MGIAGARAYVNLPWFTAYKLFNSLFLGMSIGSVFVLYTPLSPTVFSAGGIGLALGTLLIATQYHRLFNPRWFFGLSLAVELIILMGIVGVLIHPLDQPLALFVYVGYQFTFAFGSYLVRCETLLIAEQSDLAKLDVAKQAGYLLGMAAAWLFYQWLEQAAAITQQVAQVQAIHWPLLGIECLVLVTLAIAFRGVLTARPAR